MSDRFRFALKEIDSAQWQRFERLASVFLADEFGTLRTLASPSGDGGRDAILFQPDTNAATALQFSIQKDWKAKIHKTAKQLADRHDSVSVLIYVTSLSIGADADETKASIQSKFHIYLDVRDRSWFIEREHRSPATANEAAGFCKAIADPVLVDAGLIDRTHTDLTSHEAHAALLYLVLQQEDDTRDRHFTKQCFDALVKAVLRDSDNNHRISRADIYSSILELVPSQDTDDVRGYVDRALERLGAWVRTSLLAP